MLSPDKQGRAAIHGVAKNWTLNLVTKNKEQHTEQNKGASEATLTQDSLHAGHLLDYYP